MIIHGPLISTPSAIFLSVAAMVVVLALNWRFVDAAETEAIARSCMSKGMVARLDVSDEGTLVYCQTPENAGGYIRKR